MITDYLFFDCETVPFAKTLDECPERMQDSFAFLASKNRKSKNLPQWHDLTDEELFQNHAPLYAEFNKIVCLSIGRLDKDRNITLRSILTPRGKSEKKLLNAFAGNLMNEPDTILSGYNIIGFDMPLILKHLVKYQIPVPHQLKVFKKKPWDIQCVDLMDVWTTNRINQWPSLELVAAYLGCSNPKEGMVGSEVKNYYYDDSNQDENLELIKTYCEGDVRTTIEIFLKVFDLNLIENK